MFGRNVNLVSAPAHVRETYKPVEEIIVYPRAIFETKRRNHQKRVKNANVKISPKFKPGDYCTMLHNRNLMNQRHFSFRDVMLVLAVEGNTIDCLSMNEQSIMTERLTHYHSDMLEPINDELLSKISTENPNNIGNSVNKRFLNIFERQSKLL